MEVGSAGTRDRDLITKQPVRVIAAVILPLVSALPLQM